MKSSEKVKRLVRALKWYANEANWRKDDWGVPAVIMPPEYGCPGKKARAALKSVGAQP